MSKESLNLDVMNFDYIHALSSALRRFPLFLSFALLLLKSALVSGFNNTSILSDRKCPAEPEQFFEYKYKEGNFS